MNNDFIYAVRDKVTGKLISDLTSKHKKYWIKEADCKKAIANNYWYKNADLEIIKLKPVEVTDTNYSTIITKDIDAFAEWLANIGAFEDSPWLKWYDENFCKKCKPVVCKYEDSIFDQTFEASECEFEDGKCPFGVYDWTDKDIIKAWLLLKKEG